MNRDDLLVQIYNTPLGEKELSKVSKSVLRKLAAECLVEVETRRCITWNFGAPFPNWRLDPRYTKHQVDRDEYARQQKLYVDDSVHRSRVIWRDRTEVWTRITQKGVEYLTSLGLI